MEREGGLTSSTLSSDFSFHLGLSAPTLALRSVRDLYRAGSAETNWVTPLSMPSMASTKSSYSLTKSFWTVGSVGASERWVAMMSRPKCLVRFQREAFRRQQPLELRFDRMQDALVDETGTAELGLPLVAEHLKKAPLVVVVSVSGSVVYASDIDDDRALLDCRSDEGRDPYVSCGERGPVGGRKARYIRTARSLLRTTSTSGAKQT